jgi:hypothetical protein
MKKQSTCQRCSGKLQKLSGFKVCAQCGHRLGSQSLDIDWQNISDTGIKRIGGADNQSKPYRGNNPRRRVPLNFDED